jgi:hypothetical protein
VTAAPDDGRPVWWPLAVQALHQAQREEWDAVGHTLNQLDREHHGEGVLGAMVGWIDTLAGTAGLKAGDHLRIGWVHLNPTCDPRSTPEEAEGMRWVGAIIEARISMDQDAFHALIDECITTDDLDQWNYNVGHLLTTVALNLNQISGYKGGEDNG